MSPAFRRLWAAGFVSELGDWVLRVALPVYVYGLTGSAAATATTFVVGLLPSLALAPVAGVLADRWDRRRTMIAVSLAQAAVLAPLLAVDGPEQLWILNAVTAAQAALAALFEPARHALVPALVAPERLPAANGMIGLGENLARLAGAALGGILLAAGGLPAVLLVDAASFLLAALLLARPLGAAAGSARGAAAPVLRSWLEGLREIRDGAALRPLAHVVALMSLSQGIFVVLFVVFVTDRLGGGEAEVGVLRAVQAVGGLLGGALAGALARRLGAGRQLALALPAFGAVAALAWNGPLVTTALPYYLVVFALAGAPGVLCTAAMFSIIGQDAPAAARGRVLSSFATLVDGATAVGMVLAGALVARVGLGAMLDVQAALYVLAGLLWLRRSAEERPQHERDRAEQHEPGDDRQPVLVGEQRRAAGRHGPASAAFATRAQS